jgi:hypothetical protein
VNCYYRLICDIRLLRACECRDVLQRKQMEEHSKGEQTLAALLVINTAHILS